MLTLLKIKKDIAHRIMQGLLLWDNFRYTTKMCLHLRYFLIGLIQS